MGEQAPAFSFYAKDFLAAALSLSLAARGAYITLLSYQWDNGAVPSDATARQRILGCSKREADALWSDIASKFEAGEDGQWRNDRLERERGKQAKRRAALAENGKKGADNRWPKNGNHEAKAIAIATAGPLASASQRDGLSFSSSVLHTHPARGASLISPGAHRSHAMCGIVCFPSTAFESCVKKLGGADAKVRAWALGVMTEWQGKVDRGEAVPDGDDFVFWRHRWAESFGSTKTARVEPGTLPAGMCRNRHTPPCSDDIECSARRRREMDSRDVAS